MNQLIVGMFFNCPIFIISAFDYVEQTGAKYGAALVFRDPPDLCKGYCLPPQPITEGPFGLSSVSNPPHFEKLIKGQTISGDQRLTPYPGKWRYKKRVLDCHVYFFARVEEGIKKKID